MSITFPNILFVILIAIASSYLTFLTAKGGLTDNRFNNPFKVLTQRGKIVLSVLIFIALLLTGQEYNSQTKIDIAEKTAKIENAKKDALLLLERNQRDSIITNGIKVGIDSSSTKLFNEISLAFKKQGLKIDTLNKTIKIIRDSSKAKVTNNYMNQEDPFFAIDTGGIKIDRKSGDKTHYSITFSSHFAASTNYDIKTYVIFQFADGSNSFGIQHKFLDYTAKIPKNGAIVTGMSTMLPEEAYNGLYLYIKGKYTTLDGKKSYNIDDLYRYNLKTRRTEMTPNSYKENILKLIPKE